MEKYEIDKKLTEGQPQEVLLRLATIDRVIKLFKGKNLSSPDYFIETFDKIYNKLKEDGSRQDIH